MSLVDSKREEDATGTGETDAADMSEIYSMTYASMGLLWERQPLIGISW